MKHPNTGESLKEVLPAQQPQAIKNIKLTLMFFSIDNGKSMWVTEADYAKLN